ncbi:MAG: hypothetical protein ABI402_05165 [Ferruginibacter sp.]
MHRIFLLILIILASSSSHAQNAMLTKFPKVAVEISLRDSIFTSFEDIDITISLTNKEKKDQNILFDKPDKKIYPWGVSISLEDEKGKSFIKFASPEMVSTQLYTEKQLKKSGYYSLLKANGSMKNIYALYAIAIYETGNNNKFPKGKYKLQLTYYGNVSNSISFELQ